MGEDIREIARRTFEEIMPSGDVEAFRAVTDPDVIDHSARPDEPPGIEAGIATMLWLRTVFADERWEVERVIVEGDLAVVHAIHHGRHVGNLMGIEPTGREVAYPYIHILRFRDGRGVEHWGVRDHFTLMQQLGVIPDRPPVAAATA
ncbi:MAG TPA: ester cyclase [Candidatus Limnocylindrales bacterium]